MVTRILWSAQGSGASLCSLLQACFETLGPLGFLGSVLLQTHSRPSAANGNATTPVHEESQRGRAEKDVCLVHVCGCVEKGSDPSSPRAHRSGRAKWSRATPGCRNSCLSEKESCAPVHQSHSISHAGTTVEPILLFSIFFAHCPSLPLSKGPTFSIGNTQQKHTRVQRVYEIFIFTFGFNQARRGMWRVNAILPPAKRCASHSCHIVDRCQGLPICLIHTCVPFHIDCSTHGLQEESCWIAWSQLLQLSVQEINCKLVGP